MEINEKILKLKVRESELKEELAKWESHQPVNNMGKWARQTKIDRISEKLKKVQEKIHFHDSIYLSNEIYNEWKKGVK
jgi:lipid II:glycine glycyltransferase (peptidoglycan interpeptide bridge formation enzyme)